MTIGGSIRLPQTARLRLLPAVSLRCWSLAVAGVVVASILVAAEVEAG
ncbi:MAG: hypothetical protein GYA58_03255 [Anaerolineaceae bacterium]|nr:hypothetical protein [Anaerolineaceae bacterium]